MPRVPRITERSQVAEEHGEIFDSITSSRGQVSGPFSVLLNSPEAAGRAAHLGAYLRFDSTLPDDQRELAIITAAREFDCDYEWSAHSGLAQRAGVRDEAIEVVANRGSVDSLTSEEATIVSYGRELFQDHRVSDATFEAAKGMFGDQGVTELTATMGYYGMLACALNAFQVDPGPDAPRLP
ncbi:MAG: carboxymuconolactone decarboxylase family protein [SAR202 cluster bacterium]|jgi:4-carboxymuconolactone decarboxylase|nr:carboxymuconolactone decarboxylase family protein [SAR202 cluster bacterium]MDP6715202.1 carboxymuconolactone decarboxylase family protein [SAR202 cluster bacterium]